MASGQGRREFRILIASDGSPSARAALRTALTFPWAAPSHARGVVALGSRYSIGRGPSAEERRLLYAGTDALKRRLTSRWRDATVVALHEAPADAIFSEARRFRAGAIVLGWRGHGAFRRLLAGTVSRDVVARAGIPVLVARTALDAVRRVIIGFDASPGALEAVRFASRLERPRGSRIVLTTVIEPISMPLRIPRLPASMAQELRSEIARLNLEQMKLARRHARAAAGILKRAGWPVKIDLQTGIPLDRLLEAAHATKGTVLVVGARAKTGVKRMLLGSVAEGALDYSRAPVVIVR